MKESTHHKLNDSYHCQRAKHGSLINVFNQDWYLMALYDEHTGIATWHRLVSAPQRALLEAWVRQQFPVIPKTTSSSQGGRGGRG